MDSLNVEIVRMSGSEFEDICNLTKIPNKDLLELFDVSNGTLYNYFKRKRIPDDVEEIVERLVKDDERFRDAYNRVIKKADPPAVLEQAAIVQSIGDIMKSILPVMTQTISQALAGGIKDAISEFSVVVQRQMDAREKDYEGIRTNNAKLATTVDGLAQTNATMFAEFTQLLSEVRQPMSQGKPKFGPTVKK